MVETDDITINFQLYNDIKTQEDSDAQKAKIKLLKKQLEKAKQPYNDRIKRI
jgi:hypothetical protein